MILIVHLTPKASANKIDGWAVDVDGKKVLRVRVTAVPENGKANEGLIKLLSKTFHLSKSKIVLIRGEASRIKHFKIEEDPSIVEKIIESFIKKNCLSLK
ncbi:MAG: DUF167 family protein [Alphaproteobacteria bacterium]|nr:DUF167 family protein [Alphaproteobacteria bacterium]